MKTNDSTNACPRCGAPVPADAPQGLCPQCVFAQAAAPEPAATATANIPSFDRLAAAFPQLQILELVGRGAMGFVFKARQPHLDRFVALKLLPDSLAQDPHFAERFNREGRTLARLNHPNIVSVFDFGQTGGFYYLLMEYVDGVNLRQAMQAGRFSPGEALAIVPKICEALQYAHEEGVLHRDIKPENILLDAKGRVKIADFGIAKIVGEEKAEPALTGTGAALGTPHYMAPEQLEKPGSVDHRADIYSLGVVFYEMLTGELPIGRFSPPSQRTPVDPRVDDVVMRTLEKEREKRFQSAGEVKTNVEHLTEAGAGNFQAASPKKPGGTVVINPNTIAPAIPRWSQKAVWAAVLTGLSLPLPLLIIVLVYLTGGGIGAGEIAIALAAISLPGLVGTILGWMALSDIRAHHGQLRGLPLAVFAALAWPLLVLVGITVGVPYFVLQQPLAPGKSLHVSVFLMLLVPIGAITFAIWAVYTAARWGGNQPASQRRGVLKWVFLALMLFGVGAIILPKLRAVREVHYVKGPPVAGQTDSDATPFIRFTFTAVELREAAGVRWLAIDYLDDVHGDAEKSFSWEANIDGFKPESRTAEFLGGDKDAPVRHQRIEYRMPDSMIREQLERFRDEVAMALNHKSFRLEAGEEKQLFELVASEGGTLTARVRVLPSANGLQPSSPQTAAQPENQAEAASEKMKRPEKVLQFRLVADDADTAAPVDVMMEWRGGGISVPVRVLRTVLLDGSAVAQAGIVLETNDSRKIGIELTTEGARQFGAITAANTDRRIAIIVDGRVLSAPVIRSAIPGGVLQISGSISAAEVDRLVAALNHKPFGLEFSPTVERSLPRAPEFPPGAIFLDLETGEFVTNRTFQAGQRDTRDWLQTSGADLRATGLEGLAPTVEAFDLAWIEAPVGAWDSMSAPEIGWNWALMRNAAKRDSRLASRFGRADTFLFRTREDTFGILQILSATNTAPVVRVRYKLVQDTRTKSF